MIVDRVVRKGVCFTCETCGKLLIKCNAHNATGKESCPNCSSGLKKVGIGNQMVGFAVWFKCLKCKKYFMGTRGAIVETRAREGFDKFA